MKLEVYKNPEFGSIRTALVKEDKTILQRSENTTFAIPNRGLTIINESGLYSLILSSKMPKAKEFKHWVTSEVLPSIRKHGLYATMAHQREPLKRREFTGPYRFA